MTELCVPVPEVTGWPRGGMNPDAAKLGREVEGRTAEVTAEFGAVVLGADENPRQGRLIKQKMWISGGRANPATRRWLAGCKEDPFSADAGLLS